AEARQRWGGPARSGVRGVVLPAPETSRKGGQPASLSTPVNLYKHSVQPSRCGSSSLSPHLLSIVLTAISFLAKILCRPLLTAENLLDLEKKVLILHQEFQIDDAPQGIQFLSTSIILC
ncbi:unnamed protein product, partial [Urochloa humidicola]